MGRATDAVLLYGYDLGGRDDWRLRGLGQYGEMPSLDWFDEDDDTVDFARAAEERLLETVSGFHEAPTPEAWQDGYADRRKAAQRLVGVKVETYRSDAAPAYALAAHATVVHRGDVETIDPVDLAERPLLMNWDPRLAAALDALGLEPVQQAPAWLLVSYADGF